MRPPTRPRAHRWFIADYRSGNPRYQCVNAPYTQWPELFPPLQRGVLTAAERTGALLVALENLYGYGPTGGRPMTEDLPLAATGAKGRTRAAMTAELLAAATAGRVRIAIGRASDFFGAGVTQGSTLGEPVFGNALAGRRADFIGNPGLPHSIVRRRAVWTRLMTAQARLRHAAPPRLELPALQATLAPDEAIIYYYYYFVHSQTLLIFTITATAVGAEHTNRGISIQQLQ